MIHSNKVVLKPLFQTQIETYISFVNSPSLQRMTEPNEASAITYSQEQIAKWFQTIRHRDDRYDFAIYTTDDDVFIGEIVFNEINLQNGFAHMRMAITPSHQNKGYGSETLSASLAYAKSHLKLRQIELEVFDFNKRAIHLYAKHGFELIRQDTEDRYTLNTMTLNLYD